MDMLNNEQFAVQAANLNGLSKDLTARLDVLFLNAFGGVLINKDTHQLNELMSVLASSKEKTLNEFLNPSSHYVRRCMQGFTVDSKALDFVTYQSDKKTWVVSKSFTKQEALDLQEFLSFSNELTLFSVFLNADQKVKKDAKASDLKVVEPLARLIKKASEANVQGAKVLASPTALAQAKALASFLEFIEAGQGFSEIIARFAPKPEGEQALRSKIETLERALASANAKLNQNAINKKR